MRPPLPIEHHVAESTTDITVQLIKIEAKIDAQLSSLKESVGEVKKDIKQIQEHVQYINAISKVGSRILLSGGVIALCVKLLASLF